MEDQKYKALVSSINSLLNKVVPQIEEAIRDCTFSRKITGFDRTKICGFYLTLSDEGVGKRSLHCVQLVNSSGAIWVKNRPERGGWYMLEEHEGHSSKVYSYASLLEIEATLKDFNVEDFEKKFDLLVYDEESYRATYCGE